MERLAQRKLGVNCSAGFACGAFRLL